MREQEMRLRSEIREKDKKLRASQAETDELRFKLDERDDDIEAYTQRLAAQKAGTGNAKKHAADLKELHDMLRAATLETEELQLALQERDEQLDSLTKESRQVLREKERRIRELAAQQTREGRSETELLELKAMAAERERRHTGELKGLARQIQYLRARCGREEGLRGQLSYEKRFLMMQIELWGECNTSHLSLLSEMGITPDPNASFYKKDKRPSLRCVAFGIIATLRMKKMADAWAVNRKVHESLVRTLEGMRGRKKVGGRGLLAGR
ncbi:Pericentrin-AKAP-450 domain of centrosomal targeting protein-domain-containing protein [Phyllosticta citribraziliensis]